MNTASRAPASEADDRPSAKPAPQFSEQDLRKAAKGTGITLVGSGLGKGLFFLSQVIIARSVGVEEFGLYALGLAVVKICEIVARAGLNMGGLRFVSIYKNGSVRRLKGVVVAATVLALLNGLVIGLLLFLFAEDVARLLFGKSDLAPLLKVLSLSVPLAAGATVVSSLLQGFQAMKYTVYARDIVQPAANILLILLFGFLKFGLKGVIYAFIASNLAALLFGLRFLVGLFPELISAATRPLFDAKALFWYSAPLLFLGVVQYLQSWTSIILLGSMKTAVDVGIFRAATQIPLAMTLFLAATNTIYAPLAADLHQRGERQRLSDLYRTTTRWVIYAVLPLFVVVVPNSREIMVVFGSGYVAQGAAALLVLSFGQLVNCVTGGVGFTLTMTGRQNLQLLNTVLLLLVSFVLNLLLIPAYGIFGAAIAQTIAICAVNVIGVFQIYSLYDMLPYRLDVLFLLAPGALSLALIVALKAWGGLAGQASLAASALIAFGAFAAHYLLFGRNEEDTYLFNLLRIRFADRARS